MNNKIKFVLVFSLAAIVGFGVVMIVKQSNGGCIQEHSIMPLPTDTIKGEGGLIAGGGEDITEIDPSGEIEMIKVPVPELITDKVRVSVYIGKSSYYYTAKGIGVSVESGDIVYTLTDSFGHEYTSNDGSFTQVNANATGTYTLVAHDTATELSSEPKTIAGFNIIPPVSNPLSASELTSIISTGDYDGNSHLLDGRLAKSVKIKCSNSNYPYTNTIQEVFMSVYLENWIVTVTSLDYNCLKQVTCINFNAQK